MIGNDCELNLKSTFDFAKLTRKKGISKIDNGKRNGRMKEYNIHLYFLGKKAATTS